MGGQIKSSIWKGGRWSIWRWVDDFNKQLVDVTPEMWLWLLRQVYLAALTSLRFPSMRGWVKFTSHHYWSELVKDGPSLHDLHKYPPHLPVILILLSFSYNHSGLVMLTNTIYPCHHFHIHLPSTPSSPLPLLPYIMATPFPSRLKSLLTTNYWMQSRVLVFNHTLDHRCWHNYPHSVLHTRHDKPGRLALWPDL